MDAHHRDIALHTHTCKDVVICDACMYMYLHHFLFSCSCLLRWSPSCTRPLQPSSSVYTTLTLRLKSHQWSKELGTHTLYIVHISVQCTFKISYTLYSRSCLGVQFSWYIHVCKYRLIDYSGLDTVHEMHGQMHPNLGLVTVLLAHDLLSSLAYPMIIHTWQFAYKNFGC